MTAINNLDLPTPGDDDHLALSREFMELQQDVIRSNEIERKEKEGLPITEAEREFLTEIPAKMRRACDITRILRRTNTGPAKVKEKKSSSRAKMAQAEIDKLLDMDI
jgi:hypothetical protein